MLGRHIKVVGRGKTEHLSRKEVVENFLDDIAHAVGIRPVIVPFVYDNVDSECITGFIVLPTSHAVIHTWPRDALLMFDLYAPTHFHDITVIAAVVRHFGLAKYNLTDLTKTLRVPG